LREFAGRRIEAIIGVNNINEPLSVVVERQRKRAAQILALPLAERERMVMGVGRDGNGSDDSSSND
jgi:hypothetical protein